MARAGPADRRSEFPKGDERANINPVKSTAVMFTELVFALAIALFYTRSCSRSPAEGQNQGLGSSFSS